MRRAPAIRKRGSLRASVSRARPHTRRLPKPRGSRTAAAAGLPAAERRLAAIITLVIIFWISEAIPLPATALLGPALCALLGVVDPAAVFRPFADRVLFLFLGSFLLARAMAMNGLDRRVALAVLSARAVGGSPARLRLAMELCCDERAAAEAGERAALARCLIKVAEWNLPPLNDAAAVLATMASRGSPLRQRLESLLDEAPHRRRRVRPWLAVTMVALPAVCLAPVVTIAGFSRVPEVAVRLVRQAQGPQAPLGRT